MFYVAHRLFAAHDRYLGAQIASVLAGRVGSDNVFLPFCDTNEEDLQAEVKGRRLFDLDCQRLPKLHGMLAILHGPSLDDGVCMEVGYAAAIGSPIVVFTTDFQTYGLRSDGVQLEFPDPLVETVATEIVRTHHLDPPSNNSNRLAAFADRNRGQLRQGIELAVERLVGLARQPLREPNSCDKNTDVFIESSPYGSAQGWHELLARLDDHATPLRHGSRLTSTSPLEAAKQDWAAAARCSALVADISGPEAPPGAALLIGATVARGGRVIAYCPQPTWTFAHGREPNWRNLMIQYSTHRWITSAAKVDNQLLKR